MAGHVKKSVTRDGTAGTVVTVKKAALKNSQWNGTKFKVRTAVKTLVKTVRVRV